MVYDIETLPISANIWSLGEQVVRHNQLIHDDKQVEIICICYCINDGPVKIIKRDLDDIFTHNGMIKEFDEIVKSCDVVIGKNSDRFDNKHINTMRLLSGVKAMPDWLLYTNDLEKQIRRHFKFTSNSLDFVSESLGLGGKNKMEWNDWIAIKNYFQNIKIKKYMCDTGEDISQAVFNSVCLCLFGKKEKDIVSLGTGALNKMYKYGKKDVDDTRTIWQYCEGHFLPTKTIFRTMAHEERQCLTCGSTNIEKDKFRANGIITWYCNDHQGYAGRSRIKSNGEPGAML